MSGGDDSRLDALPALPRDEAGPVFAAPWEAQVFAMTVRLNEAGCFTWPEWVEAFSAELAAAPAAATVEAGDYYQRWLAALEKMVASKGLMAPAELARRKAAWAAAAERTPHGEPIVLGDDG